MGLKAKKNPRSTQLRVFARMSLPGGFCLGTIIFGLSIGVATGADYLPLMSTLTGREIARAFRTDETPPTKARADADKRACLLDRVEVPNATASRLSALAKTDREAAEIEITRAIVQCMAKKGWRIVMNGSGTHP